MLVYSKISCLVYGRQSERPSVKIPGLYFHPQTCHSSGTKIPPGTCTMPRVKHLFKTQVSPWLLTPFSLGWHLTPQQRKLKCFLGSHGDRQKRWCVCWERAGETLRARGAERRDAGRECRCRQRPLRPGGARQGKPRLSPCEMQPAPRPEPGPGL